MNDELKVGDRVRWKLGTFIPIGLPLTGVGIITAFDPYRGEAAYRVHADSGNHWRFWPHELTRLATPTAPARLEELVDDYAFAVGQ